MADAPNPFDGLGNNVTVVDSPPAQQPQPDGPLPFEGLGNNVRVAAERPRDPAVAKGIADAIADPNNPKLNWFEQVGRAASFGMVDKWIGQQVFDNLKENNPDLQLADIQDAVRRTLDREQGTTANIVGTVGAAVTAGTTARVLGAAELAGVVLTKSSVVRGTLNWLATHPRTAWLTSAVTGGAIGGAVEEGARQGVSEYLDTVQNDTFDVNKVVDKAIQGGIIGSIGAPIGAGAIAGARGLFSTVGRWLGGDAKAAVRATNEIYKRIALPGEPPADTAKRLDGYVTDYRLRNNGRSPALAEIIPPQQTADIATVVRSFRGLDIRAGELADNIVKTARDNLSSAATGGNRIMSDLQVRVAADDVFDDVIRKNGNMQVSVGKDALTVLSNNPDWLNAQAGPAAESIRRVIGATKAIGDLRIKARRVGNSQTRASGRLEVAGLRDDLAQLIDSEINASALPMSDRASLANLIRLRDAMTRHVDAQNAATEANFDLNKVQGLLRETEKTLDDFEKNGLKISLRDADHLRRNASSAAFIASRNDPIRAEILRQINDSVSQIGVPEVPDYGAARELFSKALTRVEARDIGRNAVSKDVDPRDIATSVARGRDINGRRVGPERVDSLRRGADEGVALEVSAATRSSPADLRATAARLANPDTAQAVSAAAPRRAQRISETAAQTERSLAGAEELRRPKSRSTLAAEEQQIKELVLGGFLSSAGGAAKASFVTRALVGLGIGRTAAKGMVEMLGDPKQVQRVIAFLNKKGIRTAKFATILAAAGAAGTSNFGTDNQR